jgi:hypothetical protein
MSPKRTNNTISVDYHLKEQPDSQLTATSDNKMIDVYMSIRDKQNNRLIIDGDFSLLIDLLQMLGRTIVLENPVEKNSETDS